ncbi:class I SAM-dependent methyltransferase [Streptomyces sp. NPDC055025]
MNSHSSPSPTVAVPEGIRPVAVTSAEWDEWFRSGIPHKVSDVESAQFYGRAHPKRGWRAVDIGCGHGQWTRQLVRWKMRVTGYDCSAVAVEQARRTMSHARLDYEVWDVTADSIPTGIEPGSVDLVTCRLSLAYLDMARFLVDAGRWLSPHGVFYALTPVERPDGEPSRWYHRGLTEEQIATLGQGWSSRTTYTVGSYRAILLSGYGR